MVGTGVQAVNSGQPAVCTVPTPGANPPAGRMYPGLHGLTVARASFNISPLMSNDTSGNAPPEVLDAWRMVASRRGFEGRLPLASMARLRDNLVDAQGDVCFTLDFDRDALQVAYVELRIDAELPLECQRSLQRFLFPVQVVQRLGLIRDEAEALALPEEYEPLLMPEDGMLRPAELVEDELILAVPVVALMPGTEAVERDWPVDEAEQQRANPFAALATLKKTK